mgnify:CR=1 FL=1
MNEYNSTDYDAFKTKLGIDPSFMIRFDNPFSSLDSASYNKAAVVNAQVLVLYKILLDLHPKIFYPIKHILYLSYIITDGLFVSKQAFCHPFSLWINNSCRTLYTIHIISFPICTRIANHNPNS